MCISSRFWPFDRFLGGNKAVPGLELLCDGVWWSVMECDGVWWSVMECDGVWCSVICVNVNVKWFYIVNYADWSVFHRVSTISTLLRRKKDYFLGLCTLFWPKIEVWCGIWSPHHKSDENMTIMWLYMVNHGVWHVFHHISTISTLFRTKKGLICRLHQPVFSLNVDVRWNMKVHITNQAQLWLRNDSTWLAMMNNMYFIAFATFLRFLGRRKGSFWPLTACF